MWISGETPEHEEILTDKPSKRMGGKKNSSGSCAGSVGNGPTQPVPPASGSSSAAPSAGRTAAASSAPTPKYTCRACDLHFPNWSQCLSHVRSSEVDKDPELHALTTTTEGRRELQKLCKYRATGSPDPAMTDSDVTPASTPASTPTAANAGEPGTNFAPVTSSSTGTRPLATYQSIPTGGRVAPPPGLAPISTAPHGPGRYFPVLSRSDSTLSNTPSSVMSSTSSMSYTSYGSSEQQLDTPKNLSCHGLGGIEPENDDASVCSFSSLSISPEASPPASPKQQKAQTQRSQVKTHLSTVSATQASTAPKNPLKYTDLFGLGDSRGASAPPPPPGMCDKQVLLDTSLANQTKPLGGASSTVLGTRAAGFAEKQDHKSRQGAGPTKRTNLLQALPDRAGIRIAEFLEVRDCACVVRALQSWR
eukprot:CAMPEP_0184557066 /NCGR_PEP_ID=MMETSP0199_2-20130426/41762_1 /TAXON_ID=1112570 /ORGANISM="Thraustochytrium sp., Strain LLF1b" /LENGTH=419 /DNA_ID=CAMNT_0026953891 /DNA_START=750 /DNA_END=2009 /DNA_ORIENTATION=+